MKNIHEGGFLARKREARGEGEVGRVTDRVNALDDQMKSDLEGFHGEEPELQSIQKEAVELTEKTRAATSSKLKEWAKKNTMIKMAVASIGLHAAMVAPQIVEVIEGNRTKAELFDKDWSTKGKVIHMQTDEEKAVVEQKKREREARINPEELKAYKKELSERLERGEDLSFKESYFGIEKKSGVLPEEVEQGKEHADQLIEKFSKEIGETLEKEEIQRVTNEMYGDGNYAEFQALISEYFVTGKYNCFSIDHAQQIVWEGILAHLTEDERVKWSIGEMHVKQHPITTLTWKDGSEERMFVLEPGREARTAEPEPGTAKIGASFLKQALVSEKTLVYEATKGIVAPSPELDVVTNQAINPGFIVTGELEGSDFVKAEAKRLGLEIQDQIIDAMEVEIEMESDSVEAAKHILDEAEVTHPGLINALHLLNPTVKAVQALEMNPNRSYETLEVGKMQGWSPEAKRQVLKTEYQVLSISSGIPSGFIDDMEAYRKTNGNFHFQALQTGPRSDSEGISFKELRPSDLQRFLLACAEIDLRFGTGVFMSLHFYQEMFDAISSAKVKSIYFRTVPIIWKTRAFTKFDDFSDEEVWKKMDAFASKVIIPMGEYTETLRQHPEYWEYRNIEPDIESAGSGELDAFLTKLDKGLLTKHQLELYERARDRFRLLNGQPPIPVSAE
ncbi:MAG: hypothetical protein ABIO72_06055 [Patescibacteria group bacterium]